MGLILQTTRKVLSLSGRGARGAPGTPGANGAPGGSPELIGSFTGANGMTGVPNGTLMLRTTGHREPGMGRGLYLKDDTIDAAFVAAHPKWSFRAAWADGSVHGYRLVPNEGASVLFDAFGAYGDATYNQSTGAYTGTADDAAWQAMLDFLLTSATLTTNRAYRSVHAVQFGRAFYLFNNPLSLKLSAMLRGAGTSGSQDGGYGTVFVCAGRSGLTLESYNTIGGAQDTGNPLLGSFGGGVENIVFMGASTATGQDRFGLWVRGGAAKVRGCRILYFNDDGLRVGAGDAGGSDNLGISDNHLFEDLICSYNGGSGIRCYGGDSSASTFINPVVNSNGLFGIWESSFLGNTYVGGQLDANGHGKAGKPWGAAGPSAFCSYGGKLYGVVAGQDAAAATTAPGTDPTVWYYYEDGAPSAPYIPAWAAGMTWKSGGPALFDNPNSPCAVNGMYLEGGMGLAQNPGGRAIFLNGICAQSVLNGAGAIYAINGVPTSFGGLGTKTSIADPVYGETDTQLGGGSASDGIVQKMMNTIVAPLGFVWAWDFAIKMLGLRYGGADPEIMSFATPGTTRTFGRGSPVTNPAVQMPEIFLGNGDNARNITFSDAAPTSGAAGRGDIVFNLNAAAGGNAGWICVAAGSPGTWKTFGAISA